MSDEYNSKIEVKPDTTADTGSVVSESAAGIDYVPPQEIPDQELYHSYSYVTEIRVQYLSKLVHYTPPELGKAYLVSTGTEATEMIIKLMRLQAQKMKK